MLVMLALATHVTSAQAVTPSTTITQTAITSPADPSYFYDPTAGAYGGITVTGTTNSTSPSSDQVDIDCYSDNGNNATSEYTVYSGVQLKPDGSFSVTIPYADFEVPYGAQTPNESACRLRAVPSGEAAPTTGVGSFSGPRVLLAYLMTYYQNAYGTYPTIASSTPYDFTLIAPELGVTDTYSSAGDCGLSGAYVNDQAVFGQIDGESFACAAAHSFWPYQVFGYGAALAAGVQVDGAEAYTPSTQTNLNYVQAPSPLTVSASQNAGNGDMTIEETDPLELCTAATCYVASDYSDSGVEEDRTIRQADSGHVVEVTDRFRSTDGAAHSVTVNVMSQQCFLGASCTNSNSYDPSQVGYEFPGETAFTTHASGDQVTVGSQSPATAYVQSSSANIAGAITYFTPPSGPFSFLTDGTYDSNSLIAPYQLSVPAGGSVQLSYAYSTEPSQAALAQDIPTALDLQTPPTITITSPGPGSTTAASSVTVTGTLAAVTGVASVTVNGVPAVLSGSGFSATVPLTAGPNTLVAIETASSGVTASATESVTYAPTSAPTVLPAITGWAGALWRPIANTGFARHAGAVKETLHGDVTAGSAGVSYYFAYGIRGHFNHRSRSIALRAGKVSRRVALTIGGLVRGRRYSYRLVATGRYGHAVGRSRWFKTTAHHK